MGLLSYYCLVVVFVIGIVIYDLLFYTKYKNDVCPEIVPTPAEDLARRLLEPQIDYRLHVHFLEDRILQDEAADENADEAAADENADEAAADENADEAAAGSTSGSGLSSNILTTMTIIIIFVYCAIIALIILAMLSIYCFSGMSSERFGNLNWCWACLGIYTRNFEVLTRAISWLAFLLIGILAVITITNEECREAVHEEVINRILYKRVGQMSGDSWMLVIVNGFFWIFLHFLLPCLKLFIDSESFLYEPYDREKGFGYYVCCKLLGP